MRSRLQPLFSLVTVTLLLAVTSPLPMAANPLGDRDTTVQNSNADREARTERQQREQRIQQSHKAERLSKQGTQLYRNRKYEEAIKTYQQVLAIRRELGDKAGVASALHNIGTIYFHLGRKQNKQSLNFLQEALAIRREIGDQVGVARTLYNIEKIDLNYQNAPVSDNGDTFNASPSLSDIMGPTNEVSLLFDDDEKQANPLRSPAGQRDIIPDSSRRSSPSSNRNTVPYTPPNVAYPSGDREGMPSINREGSPTR
ncbi:MAG TPA: tetratricopeptide repeat protein [Candidatus Obscuribacterales bacterium]